MIRGLLQSVSSVRIFFDMAIKKSSPQMSLAKKYGLRGRLVVELPTAPGTKTFYSTSSLKGGKHTYQGKVVTRSSKNGQIIHVSRVEKEKA